MTLTSLPQAILFDHDGVLAASEPLHWSAWEALLAELGIPYNNAEMRSFIGKTAPEILVTLLNRHNPGWDASKYNVIQLAGRKADLYLELSRTQLQTYPGVQEGLQWLKSERIKTAVVSNARRRELETTIRQLGLFDLLDVIVCREDVSSPKPDPAMYLFAATSLGIQPRNCIAVEDSPPGLEAAIMAQIPTAAVLTNFNRNALETPVPGRPELKPSWIGDSPQDFFAWLRSRCPIS
ncbi:HAD family phosphatase [Bdellovibrionota bacterium FG-2]